MLSKDLANNLSSNVILEQPNENGWGYGQIFAILARRKVWLIGTFLSVLAMSIVLTLIAKPKYESSLRVLIEPTYKSRQQSNGTVSSEMQFSDPQVQVDLTTQIQVLSSSKLLKNAVNLLQADYPDLTVSKLKAGLTLAPINGTSGSQKVQTNLIEITYVDTDSKKARNVLKTLLSVYQAYNLEQQKLRLSKGLSFINEQLPTIRRGVLESEAALEQFRRGSNIIDPSEQAKNAASVLDNVRQQREALKASLKEALANYTSLQRQLALSPKGAISSSRLSQSSLYQIRLQEIQKLDLALERQRQLLTDEHPVVQDLLKQRRALAQSLQQEAGNILGSGNISASSQQLVSSGQLGDNGLLLARQLTEVQNNVSSLQAKDQSLAQTEEKLGEELKKYPVLIAQYERLQPEVTVRKNTLQKLMDAKQDLSLEIAKGGFNWEIIDAPKLGKQISPVLIRNLLLGSVIGLFLGAISAFVREALDDTVQSAEQLEDRLPLPLLGALPKLSNAIPSSINFNTLEGEHTVGAPELFQWAPLKEALDLIYANIQLLKTQKQYEVLMVTSALAGEGKSTLSLGLALSAARQDKRVLLIDADLRQPVLHKMFSLNNNQGLSTLLTTDSSSREIKSVPQWVYMRWEDELNDTDYTRTETSIIPPSDISIDILTSGPNIGDPVKLLQSNRLEELFNIFREKYDLIIVDTPPVVGLVDTLKLGAACDGVLMVARIQQVTHSDLKTATNALSQLNLIGLIMNGVNHTNSQYNQRYIKASR
jgi:polysaccharide biosynthesis transport protein